MTIWIASIDTLGLVFICIFLLACPGRASFSPGIYFLLDFFLDRCFAVCRPALGRFCFSLRIAFLLDTLSFGGVARILIFHHSATLLLHRGDDSTRPAPDGHKYDLIAIRKSRGLVFLSFTPSMFKEPMLREFFRVR